MLSNLYLFLINETNKYSMQLVHHLLDIHTNK